MYKRMERSGYVYSVRCCCLVEGLDGNGTGHVDTFDATQLG
jgi:hypothetical protein